MLTTALVQGRETKSPRVYRAREYETVDIPIDELLDATGKLQINPEIDRKGYFSVKLVGGRVRLQAGSHVGLIPLNEHAVVEIRPRVPIANLSRMIRISRRVPEFFLHERRYGQDAWNESLIDVYADSLIQGLETIASEGLVRAYRQEEDLTSFPRGRIRIGPSIQYARTRGMSHKLVTTWFDRTADTPPNRCLKYAIWLVADRLRRAGPTTRARRMKLGRLSAFNELLSEAELDLRRGFMNDPVVRGARPLPSLRQYYRPALDVAIAIVLEQGADVRSQAGPLTMPSFVINMNYVFEDYLRNVLQNASLQQSWVVDVLDGNHEGKKKLFDTRPSEDATPDIVFRRRSDGSYPLIIEVKNVPVTADSSRDAIEQAITYAVTYRCNHVVLAHPENSGAGGSSSLRLQGRIGDLHVYQYMFDLSNTSLEESEEAFGSATESLIAAESPSSHAT